MKATMTENICFFSIRFKDGEPIEKSDKYEIDYSRVDGKCRLAIKDFSRQDEGVYKCHAKNELGEASTKATLKVSCKLITLFGFFIQF